MKREQINLRRFLLLCCVVFITHPLQAAEWGTLTGQFVYTGKPAKLPKLEISRDQEICGKFSDQVVDQSLVIGKKGGVSNIFLYLRESKMDASQIHTSYQKLSSSVKIQNKGCIFQPHVSGIWVKKQKLEAVNADLCAHGFQVKAYRNHSLNQLLPPGETLSHRFEYGEKLPLRLSCSIHPWQEGWLLALNHPYFSTTDESGVFSIKNLPVGDWEFQVWHEKAGYLIARPEWTRGRVKLKITPGENDLGVIKVTPSMFAGK